MPERSSPKTVQWCGGIATLLGLGGGFGWVLGVPSLFTFIPDGASMKLNTALGVAGLGIALLVPRLRSLLASLTILLAGGALFEFLIGHDVGLDHAFVRDALTPLANHPGRTSPSTALALTLVGVAILIGNRSKRTGQWVALAALTVALDAVVIHAYALGLSGVDTGMALPTGLGVLAAACGAANLSLGPGPLAVFTSPRMGGRLTRKLVPMLAASIVATGWITARAIALTTYRPGLWVAAQSIVTCTLMIIAAWWYAGRLNREDERREEAQRALQSVNDELEKLIAERTAELAAANREMVAFVDAVSHDIRAPIRAIIANSSIVLDECGDSLNSEHADMLRNAADRAKSLADLVSSLLRYTRVSGATPDRHLVDLSALARSVAQELENPNHCAVIVTEGLSVHADGNLVRLIFGNLIGNAVKFSKAGGDILVGKLELAHETAFFVRDHGLGFAMEDAEKVFEPLKRLVRESEFPGAGMGLANVRRAAERHGGRVWAESSPGEGATFFFTLE